MACLRRLQFFGDGLALSGLGGAIVGFCMALGLCLALFTPVWQFGLYLFLLSVFHFMEFVMTSIFHPETLSFDSWLLNHSKEYHIAIGGQ